MAKQIGEIKITGTIAGITFYRMEGQYYARRQSSLSGKQVKRDLRFKRTMQSARRLGRGSQLASKVYRSLPRPKQVYALYKELKRIAVLALKEGKSEEEVRELLQQRIGKPNASERMTSYRMEKEKANAPLPHFNGNLFVSFIQVSNSQRYNRVKAATYVLRE